MNWNPRNELIMDLHNNNVGIRIGSQLKREGKTSNEDVAKAVYQALQEGKLKVIDY